MAKIRNKTVIHFSRMRAVRFSVRLDGCGGDGGEVVSAKRGGVCLSRGGVSAWGVSTQGVYTP